MLDAGRHILRVCQVASLESAYLRRGKRTGKPGLLSAGFHDTSPAWIPDIVHHGSKRHLNTAGSRFLSRHTGTGLRKLRVKGAPKRQGDRIDGSVAVYDIHHKNHGDPMRIVLHMHVLHFLHLSNRRKIQNTSNPRKVLIGQSQLHPRPRNVRRRIQEHIRVILR